MTQFGEHRHLAVRQRHLAEDHDVVGRQRRAVTVVISMTVNAFRPFGAEDLRVVAA